MTNGNNPAHETLLMLHWNPTPVQFAAYKEREVELCEKAMEREGKMHITSLFSDDTLEKAREALAEYYAGPPTPSHDRVSIPVAKKLDAKSVRR